MRAIRQIISLERMRKTLLEPGYRLRKSAGSETRRRVRCRQMPAVRTGQQADDDFLLDQRSQPGNEGELIQHSEEPKKSIEQGSVE